MLLATRRLGALGVFTLPLFDVTVIFACVVPLLYFALNFTLIAASHAFPMLLSLRDSG